MKKKKQDTFLSLPTINIRVNSWQSFEMFGYSQYLSTLIIFSVLMFHSIHSESITKAELGALVAHSITCSPGTF